MASTYYGGPVRPASPASPLATLYDPPPNPPPNMTGLGSHGGASAHPGDVEAGYPNANDSWGAGYHETHDPSPPMMFAENEEEERRQLETNKSMYALNNDYAPVTPETPPTLLSNVANPPAGGSGGDPRGEPPLNKMADPVGYTYDQPENKGKRLLQVLGILPPHPQIAAQMRQRGHYRKQQRAIFAYILAVIYVAIFVAELVLSDNKTGSAIQTKPQINPMIGPGAIFLINFGARSGGCMRPMPGIDPAMFKVPCLNVSNADAMTQARQQCNLAEICNLSDPRNPDQTWRLFSPIFLHTGVIHLLVNVIVQVTICAESERLLGSLIFLPLYLLGGVAGNLLGVDFGLVLQTAVGASGAIFTSIGVEVIDVIYNWQYEWRACARFATILITALISIGLGLLPYMDNFAHIGGFATGILGGMVVCNSIHPSRSHRVTIWICRIIGLAGLAAFLIAIGIVFKNADDPRSACHWCRYLSCLPVFKQCKGNGLTYSPSDGSGNGASMSNIPSGGASPTGGVNGSPSNSYDFGRRGWPTPYLHY